MPKLRNINPLGAVDLPLIGRTLAPGEEFEVTAEQAGRAPSGSAEAGDYDPGEGLLGQADNYELVKPKRKPAKRPAKKAPAGTPTADAGNDHTEEG